MADVTFGVVGNSDSYYPLSSDESRETKRGLVDIIRVPIGTNCNKLYWPGTITRATPQSRVFTTTTSLDINQDDVFVRPRSDEYSLVFSDLNSPNSNRYAVGFRRSCLAYKSYVAGDSASNSNYKWRNHAINWRVAENNPVIDGMTVMFNVDLPYWQRQYENSSDAYKAYLSMNAGYQFTDRLNSNYIRITMTDISFDTNLKSSFTTSSPKLWVRLESNVNGVNEVDIKRTIREDSQVYSASDIDSGAVGIKEMLPQGTRNYRYTTDYYNSSFTSTTSDVNIARRLSGNFEFEYGRSNSALYISGYISKIIRGSMTADGMPLKDGNIINYDKFRVKLWEGDLKINLGAFDTSFRMQSNRSNVNSDRHSSRIWPLEVTTGFCRILYPSLYETFRVKKLV